SGGSAQPTAGDKIEKARRAVHLPGQHSAIEVAVLDRAAMTPGQRVIGPAIIEQADATTLLTGGWSALVAPSLTLILEQDA
ncbi:MAG: hydantoinase/oxoprolinase family protein, partial [Alphaproteobacteria bacterium]|nr:hydantoinase/oxoprolinase family protein [Alphaproteobacteria bacterium]